MSDTVSANVTETKNNKKQKRYFDEKKVAAKGTTIKSKARIDSENKNQVFDGETINVEAREKFFRKPRSDIKLRRKAKLDQAAVARHSRGRGVGEAGIKTNYFKQKLKRKEVYVEFSNEQAARTEILRNEEEGYLYIISFVGDFLQFNFILVILRPKKEKRLLNIHKNK